MNLWRLPIYLIEEANSSLTISFDFYFRWIISKVICFEADELTNYRSPQEISGSLEIIEYISEGDFI
jgi:hypothetical protein